MLLFLFKGLISKLVSPYLTLCMQRIVLENISTLQWKVFWIVPSHVPCASKNTEISQSTEFPVTPPQKKWGWCDIILRWAKSQCYF